MKDGRLLTLKRIYIATRRASDVRSSKRTKIGLRCARCRAYGPGVSVRCGGSRIAIESATYYAARNGWLLWEPLVLCPNCLSVVPWQTITHVRLSLILSNGAPVQVYETAHQCQKPKEDLN